MIAKIIRKLTNKHIMHRNICMENIIVEKAKKDKRKNIGKKTTAHIKITGFDLAMCFAKGKTWVR